MPLFIAALWGALVPMLGSMVGRVLVSLGIGYVTYRGLDTTVGWAKGYFLQGLTGLPGAAVQLAGMLKVGSCVSMLLSAFTARLLVNGMVGGAVKRMVSK